MFCNIEFDAGILDLNAPVVFFPVRHHSPACARLVRQLALEIRPAAILIEGPSDFNSQISELFLPHQLPIAIYSYTSLTDGARRGAFYPFCVYSPEWQALQVCKELDIPVKFIDLSWAEVANVSLNSHRYADTEWRRSSYVERLCEKVGAEGLNELWDLLFEINSELTPVEYLERCHQFCFHARLLDGFSPIDIHREGFMAEQIQQALTTYSGQILVVTGGLHSYALYAKLFNKPFLPSPPTQHSELSTHHSPRGIALTPYSYERLDGLTGYDAGMPSPGFYHQVWHDRLTGDTDTYRKLLTKVVRDLRASNQIFSSADLIAVETTALSLASLRGHVAVWRQDLIDAITACLIKEEIDTSRTHPFLLAVYDILRGDAQGKLASGTSLPPLVQDIKQLLQQYNLEPTKQARLIDLNLHKTLDLQKSYILHKLRILDIAGYTHAAGSDLINRQDLSYIWEQWAISLHPLYEASCIESAIYGTTLTEAAETKLLEQAARIERDAVSSALLLLDACLMGLQHLAEPFYQKLLNLIRSDSDFFSLTEALEHILYLYCYDEILGTTGQDKIGTLLAEAFTRGLWLLESLGQVQGKDQQLLQGIKVLLETFSRCWRQLNLNRDEFINILQRVNIDSSQTPLLRGAACGVLWSLNAAPTERVLLDLRSCAQPNMIGDFLTGLFCLAREVVQRHPDLLLNIDELITSFDEQTFLEALPALHLAFTYFTPREKHNIASTLVKAWGNVEPSGAEHTAELEVSTEVVAQAQAFETKLLTTLKRYGLRGIV